MKISTRTYTLLFVLATAELSVAQQTNNLNTNQTLIGTMSQEEFKRVNEKGAATVASVNPGNDKLSKADQHLMAQVALSGHLQQEISRIAMQKAVSQEVRQLAKAELEEQTGLAAKLKEIATARGATLPAISDVQTKTFISRINELSGEALDRFYVQESGINGHEKLDQVMTQVETEASDSSLKDLAAAALPLVKTHLQLARETLRKLSDSGTTNR